jgi:integral membrane protein
MPDDSERVVAGATHAQATQPIATAALPAAPTAGGQTPPAPTAAHRVSAGALTFLRIVAGRQQPRNPLRIIHMLRVLAVTEATAFLTLLTIAIVHGVTGGLGWELFVMGNVHGAVFTSYLVIITVCHRIVRWGPLMLLMVLLAGFVPGGGLMVERWALAAPAREAYQAQQEARPQG